MRIAIDARPGVSAGMTGIGHYTRELIARLPLVDPETTYVAWYLQVAAILKPWKRQRFFAARPNLVERWTPFPATWFERLSQRWSVPRVEWFARSDVLFAPNFVPPPTATRRLVVTVHDLAFRLFPETAPHSTREWLGRLDRALEQAAEIIAVSEATKRDLVRLYPVAEERVTVIPHGVDRARHRPAAGAEVAEVRARYRLDEPYLLFVGGIEPRKNLPGLVRAFAMLEEAPSLVIAGSSVSWNPEGRGELRAALATIPGDARDRIRFTGYVGDREKVALLTGAAALVFPSRYEGFGMPVLEAMACGTPVVTSKVSALPEVAGDAALYVDPDDPGDVARGMREVLEDEGLRAHLRREGLARVGAFDWDETARRTAKVLHRAALA